MENVMSLEKFLSSLSALENELACLFNDDDIWAVGEEA